MIINIKMENEETGVMGDGQYTHIRDSTDKRNVSTPGMRRREEVYAKQYDEGFKFDINSPSNEVKERKKECEERGLEVFVGPRAFRENGEEYGHYHTILVRKKSK